MGVPKVLCAGVKQLFFIGASAIKKRSRNSRCGLPEDILSKGQKKHFKANAIYTLCSLSPTIYMSL